VPTFISSGQYRRQLSRGEIVVVVSQVGNAGLQWQAKSDFYMRIAGGYFTVGASHRTDLPLPVQHLSNATPEHVAQFERFLLTDHIGAILLDARHEPLWAGIFAKVGLVGHTTGGVIVYQANGCQSCHTIDWTQLRKEGAAA